MAGRATCTDRLFTSEDLLGLSPEDDLRPPVKEDPLCLSLRGRELFSRRLGEPRAPASLPSMGENKRGLPLHRVEQERSCDAGILQLPPIGWTVRGWTVRGKIRFPTYIGDSESNVRTDLALWSARTNRGAEGEGAFRAAAPPPSAGERR